VAFHENSLFGQSGSKEFVKTCEAMGIKVLMKEGYEHGAVDFKPLLTNVKAAKPDFVYMISYVMDAALLMRQAKELDLNPKLFVGGGAGFTLPGFAKNAGEASENVFSADLWGPRVPYPGAKSFFDKYLANSALPQSIMGRSIRQFMSADALKALRTHSCCCARGVGRYGHEDCF
jgi:branched-chain amino acid transport system substrate-binding protein